VERYEREPLGLLRLGLARPARRPPVGQAVLLRDLPARPRRSRPDPAVLAGQPVLRRSTAPHTIGIRGTTPGRKASATRFRDSPRSTDSSARPPGRR
jgi:hypothetical protein